MGREVVGGREMYRVWGCGEHVEDGVKAKDTSALFELDMAARVAIAVWYVDSQGGSVRMSEGWRPTGIRSDADVHSASQTSMGMSTQWFQVGRMWRGETPSAIIPNADGSNASAHNRGRAWDSNAPTQSDMRLRAEGCALAGLRFNVPSESWHCEPLWPVPSTVDIRPWIEFVKGKAAPATPAPTPIPKDLKKESTTMTRLYQEDGRYQADKKDGKIFVIGGGGAGYINDPNIVNQIIEMNRRAGLTGPCWTEVEKVPWNWITNLSQCLQEGSLATANLAETRSLTGTPQKPGILRRIANFLKI